MKIPKITNKQQEIVKLLYSYRFLNRIQIQVLMGHKDKKTINMWLRDLKQKQYVEWIYSDRFAEKTKPAIYFIAINGVRFIKTFDEYPLEEIRKRYRESLRSRTFIDRCLLLADCCISLRALTTGSKQYTFELEADYRNPDSGYHFLNDSELVRPQLCFIEQILSEGEAEVNSYLLEIFDPTLPRYRIKKRLGDYVRFLDDQEWQNQTQEEAPPIILLVCPRISDLIYAKRRTRGLLAELWEPEDEDRPSILFATAAKLQDQRFIGTIWGKA